MIHRNNLPMEYYLQYLPSTENAYVPDLYERYKNTYRGLERAGNGEYYHFSNLEYVIAGLYVIFKEKKQEDNIKTLEEFLDGYSEVGPKDKGLRWPPHDLAFNRMAQTLCSKFEEKAAFYYNHKDVNALNEKINSL